MIVTLAANNKAAPAVIGVAEARLQGSPYLPVQKLLCTYEDGKLILHGSVPSFFHLQQAQTAVKDIAGINEVVSQIEVID